MHVDHLVERMRTEGAVAVRNGERLDALCDALDSAGIDYLVARGRGGWHLTKVSPSPLPGKVGGHSYPGVAAAEAERGAFYTSDCAHGCGCWLGGSRSGGPAGLDPFGDCPNAAPA